jgi:SAM-dependent methyltransferase
MAEYSKTIGVSSKQIWVPTPTDIMKRAALMDLFKPCLSKPGAVLEIGCGVGALIYELIRNGFWGKGVDFSENGLNIAKAFNQTNENKFIFGSSISEDDFGPYDYVIAIAVLEHIEDDVGCLRQWHNLLKADGKLLLAVPGHMSLWGSNDVWAGHYRRYERLGLFETVTDAGFSVQKIHAYGYPVINLIKCILESTIYNRIERLRKNSKVTIEEASSNSGIDRDNWSKLFWIYSSNIFKPVWKILFLIQGLFYNTEKGTGYILLAEKKQ